MSVFNSAGLTFAICLLSVSIYAQPTWKRAYGGFDTDLAHQALLTQQGDIVIVGSTGSFGAGGGDVYLFKVDEFGDRIWSTTLGGALTEDAQGIVEMDDGGFVIGGSTNATSIGDYDGLVMRTNSDGELLWQRNYGGSNWDFIYSVTRHSGGVFLAGVTYSYGANGVAWLLNINEQGDTLWTTRTAISAFSELRSVKGTQDGGCIAAGASTGSSGELDALVIKYDASGEVEWYDTYGGDEEDFARDIILTEDGGYSILGVTNSFNTVTEMYHFKIDDAGGMEWDYNWGQVSDQEGFQHIQLVTGEYASIGFVTQGGEGGKEMFLQKHNVDGDFILGQTQGGIADDIGHSILRMTDGYLLCGITQSFGSGLWDVFLVRTNEIGFTDSDDVISSFDPLSIDETEAFNSTSSVYPNPSTGDFTISNFEDLSEVLIFDQTGRLVEVPISIDGRISSNLPIGSYIVEARNGAGHILRTRILIIDP